MVASEKVQQLEHQLSEAKELLTAARTLLKKCDQGPYVKDVLGETYTITTPDGEEIECDGHCLMEDIDHFFATDTVGAS